MCALTVKIAQIVRLGFIWVRVISVNSALWSVEVKGVLMRIPARHCLSRFFLKRKRVESCEEELIEILMKTVNVSYYQCCMFYYDHTYT